MISVLIPIFNYNVTALVSSLNKQLVSAKINFEIIFIDDASTDFCFENDSLTGQDNVRFYKLHENVGRSKIRNLLAKKAKYDWLLFLDADVLPKQNDFIKTYLNCIKSEKAKVYCGGITYKKETPEDTKILRWKYGKNREEITAIKRNENPYRYFFGANFLMHESVFNSCKFNEAILKYGYEDVLFVQELKNNAISIKHIDNDVYHLGIEENQVFLTKTKQSIENLYFLYNKNIIQEQNVLILKWFKRLERTQLKGIFAKLYNLWGRIFERNLKSKTPSLFIFDIYKLTYFCYLSKVNRYK